VHAKHVWRCMNSVLQLWKEINLCLVSLGTRRFGNKRLFCPILAHDVCSLLLPIHAFLPYLHGATTFTGEQKLPFLYSVLSCCPIMEGTLALQIWRKRAFGLLVDVRLVPLKTSRQRVFRFLPNSPRK
jgi:hypothetical protein